MQGLPFDNLIGGPLNACVKAQADAAQTTINFIQQVGLNEDENGNKEAVYVYFSFVQGGRIVKISVPLLAIVPIPYIGINTIDINFKASISGVESSSYTDSFSKETSEEEKTQKKVNCWVYKKTTDIKSSISTKRDSKSTRDSSFSIEATIDVAVHASQDSMPAGMARILEMLNGSVDVFNPDGELNVSENVVYLDPDTGVATFSAQYKNKDGIYDTKDLMALASNTFPATENKVEKYVTFTPSTAGPYVIKAGGLEATVQVLPAPQAASSQPGK